MDTNADGTPEPVLLIIADISGYTRYMTANAKTLAHSQTVITELVKTIVQQIELPLEVAKLEGDAVFLYCRMLDSARRAEHKRLIGDKVMTLFRRFREIIVHRLLKNSVQADQYLLLTEAARHDVELAESIQLTAGQETYADIGTIKTLLFLPGAESGMTTTSVNPSFAARFGRSWKWYCQLWFAPWVSRPQPFSHVVSGATRFGRIGFAAFSALLTPLFLPVGLVMVFVHALRKPAPAHGHDEHEHKPDGSCCGHP